LPHRLPAVPDSSLEVRNHRSHVMGDDLQVWKPVEDPRKDEPRHCHARLVWPAEGPPDFVFRFRLARIIRKPGAASRVQQDRKIVLGHRLEDRRILRTVERLAGSVRVDLHSLRPYIFPGAAHLDRRFLKVVHRERSREGREAVGVTGDQLGHTVVGYLRKHRGYVRSCHHFNRRRRNRDNLLVVPELVHHLETKVEVEERRDVARALSHVLVVGRDFVELVKEASREDVIEDVYFHVIFSSIRLRLLSLSRLTACLGIGEKKKRSESQIYHPSAENYRP